MSRLRTRLPLSVYAEVFRFVMGVLNQQGLLRGCVAGVDSTYLRADASMKNIVRRGSGEGYKGYLKRLAKESGIASPTDEDARNFDRTRKKSMSNQDWVSSTDPEAEIMRLKVESLALFGSVARGEASAASDIDLLVRFIGPATFDAFMDVKLLLEDALGHRVDLVTETGLRKEVRPYVERDLLRVA